MRSQWAHGDSMARIPRPKELMTKATQIDEVVERGAEERLSEGKDRMTVNVYLPRRALPVIDNAARKVGMSRSTWIRLAIIEKLRREGEQSW